ncbi:hypothetical protein ACFSUS_20170 [Spirosoma soli]|uniref:Uncharacterized protein n=1 Tax=Spirosoma soli TaxID=1770529 RepID=A0ABW5M7N2_9BACT
MLFGCCVAVVDVLPEVVPEVDVVLDPPVVPEVVGLGDTVDPLVELPWLPEVVPLPLVLVALCVPAEVPVEELLVELVDWALAENAVSATNNALATITFFIT